VIAEYRRGLSKGGERNILHKVPLPKKSKGCGVPPRERAGFGLNSNFHNPGGGGGVRQFVYPGSGRRAGKADVPRERTARQTLILHNVGLPSGAEHQGHRVLGVTRAEKSQGEERKTRGRACADSRSLSAMMSLQENAAHTWYEKRYETRRTPTQR